MTVVVLASSPPVILAELCFEVVICFVGATGDGSLFGGGRPMMMIIRVAALIMFWRLVFFRGFDEERVVSVSVFVRRDDVAVETHGDPDGLAEERVLLEVPPIE